MRKNSKFGFVLIIAIVIVGIYFLKDGRFDAIASTIFVDETRTADCDLNTAYDFSIMSQNLCCQKEINSKKNSVDKRLDRLCDQLANYDTDVKCFQEFDKTWRKSILTKLSENDYYIGQTPYENTELANAIFVKKSEFYKLNSGCFSINKSSSNTTDGSSYVIWMKMKHRKTGKIITFMTTHFTMDGKEEQLEASKEIMDSSVVKNTDNYIICGDFNMSHLVNADAYNVLTSSGTKDMLIAAKNEGKRGAIGGTVHEWGKVIYNSRHRADYFFGSVTLKSKMYTLLNDTYEGGYISDHYGIMNYVSF